MSLIHTLKNPPDSGGGGTTIAPTLTPTGVKTSSYTAAVGDLVLVDTTSGTVSIGLPNAPADGAQVGVKLDIQASSHAVTVTTAGIDVFNRSSGPTSETLATLGQVATYQYQASTKIWYVISADLSLAQLDARLLIDDPINIGQEVYGRQHLVGTTVTTTSGQVRLTYFTARKSETSTQVRTLTGGTAAAATPTLCRVGLYLVDASDNGTLVAAISNDTTLWGTASTAYTRSWASSYPMIEGQRYAIGLICVTGTTAPSWLAAVQFQPPAQSEANIAPRLTGVLVSQADLPSTFTASSLTANPYRHYSVILP